ncbi:zinc finger RNA-binding protein-like isoform X2 [Dendrobium catenatum]|uniref:U1-type domain-containing protein n=1 Tax=Dendrobium catenatum TaxID=906689 RepID=A0A2I0W8S3_9ASPA|nr:zinc finger RNA-binding protein-like isoform X2 [Dendrobium catenatum]PKU72066.1 hypothetical protein MA16_Dca014666 [Dendrobium catenatum]
MDYGQMWSQPQKTPPVYDPLTAGNNIRPLAPPSSQWDYAGALDHHQQPISYSPNPTSNYYDYMYSSIQSPVKVEELTPHSAGYADQLAAAAWYPLDGAATSADPSYPYTGEGFSTAEVGGAIDGVYYGGGEDPKAIAAKDAIRQYGMHPFGYASNPGKPPKSRKIKKKNLKKATKVVQSAYCEVCKVDCNSQDVLNSHNEGKKHKKKLKQLQDSITREAAKAQSIEPAGTGESTSDENEKLDTNKKRAAEPAAVPDGEVDLETKRSRILEAGAYADDVRVCTLCNVVVNSQKVYEYHLDGLKHAAMVEKLQKAEFSW